jgi:formiminoglutamase
LSKPGFIFHFLIISALTKVITTSTDNAVLTPISSELFFKGRPGDLRLGEWVSAQKSSSEDAEEQKTSVFIYGCPDDTGVRLNRGRGGAHEGPQEIRRAFYKMALPMDRSWESLNLVECGNIEVSKNIKETHKNAFNASEKLSSLGGTVVLLGGGHDFAAPGFLGFAQGRKSLRISERFGLINVDPHLDVRELEEGTPNSGTSFRQILSSTVISGKHLIEFGCRENRNSQSHFDYCEQNKVDLQPLNFLRQRAKSIKDLFQVNLASLSKKVDTIGLTLDMDCCSELTGTSAAQAIGFSLQELYEIAFLAGAHRQVKYLEIAEVAPSLDPSGKTALGAAEVLYSFLCGKAHSLSSRSGAGLKKNFNKTPKNTRKRIKTK